ncbi:MULTISPECIES: DUF3068 domain-containing protein [Corynebacterium]|uniref:DUF3068 domain-containing protein n=1 Tax=Corynebacterium TaxID=1716 RepID=UPI00254F96F4|nr:MULTISPECIES: DUF3068 domain-containing protein [Corynebacterium]MDK6259881.1 DUF3068 domain-containing protein [Corynebacterium frankenforstense]MDK8895304.1 DUF3068 domain-containing protein [Corynebacterium sp. MSK006]
MLPKSRVVSALLVGLGVALLVAGLLAPRLLPADARLPLDIGQQTWTVHDDSARTRLMTDPDGRVLDSPVSRQYHLTLEEPSDDDTVSVRVGSTLSRDSLQDDADRLITAGVWNWRMDRLSGRPEGAALLSDQLASPTTEVDMGGVWLKFPADAQQTTYDVFDETLREAHPAEFQEELEIDGREVYRYHQVIEPANVRERYAGVFNETRLPAPEPPAAPAEGEPAEGETPEGEAPAPEEGAQPEAPEGENPEGEAPDGESPAPAAPADTGEKGYLFHSAERDYYVDQTTGLVVKIDEKIDDYYGTPDGQKVQEVLEFDGTMDDSQVSELLDAASEADAAGATVPVSWALGIIGALVALLGVLGSFGVFGGRRRNGEDRRAARSADDGDRPAARRVTRSE